MLDIGSGRVKTDIVGEDTPRFVFPSVDEDAYPVYPVERGIVTNWEEMENVLHRVFEEELELDPSEHAVLLTESPLTTKPDSERMAQLMFETFQTGAIGMCNQALLSLIASGRTSGVVLESGDGKYSLDSHFSHFCSLTALSRPDRRGADL